MNETAEQENSGLDVKFYPIRNRYLERSMRGLSRILKFTLFLCVLIALVVIADYSGYAFEDLKSFFSTAGVSGMVEREEDRQLTADQSDKPTSMYAGHSISADSSGQMHNRTSLQTMLLSEAGNTENVSQSGYFGIDVSHWQQNINWPEVASDTIPGKIDFSIVKATQGADHVDPNFGMNWKQSNEHFDMAGAYHYYIYTDDPVSQARNFIQTASLTKGNLPPIVDIELNCSKCDSLEVSSGQMVSDLKSYLSEIENHFKIKPIIYTNIPFFHKYLADEFGDYQFWMAHYEKTPPAGLVGLRSVQPDSSNDPETVLWQFTDYERLKGIVGSVDMNFLPEQALNKIEFVNGQ